MDDLEFVGAINCFACLVEQLEHYFFGEEASLLLFTSCFLAKIAIITQLQDNDKRLFSTFLAL